MAAGDTALEILISAVDVASPVIMAVASTLDALNASIASTDASFASLDAASVSVDADFSSVDAAAASASASLASIDAAASSADASLATLDASASGVDASLSSIDAAASSADAALVTLDGSAAGVDASLSSIDSAASAASASLSTIDAAASSADASLATLDAAASSVDASLASLDGASSSASASLSSIDAAAASADASLASVDATAASADASLATLDAAAISTDASLASVAVASDSAALSLHSLGVASSETQLKTNLTKSAADNLKNGLGNLAFGFKNLGTEGTIGMDAIQQGATQAGVGIAKLGLTLGAIGAVAVVALGTMAVKAAGDFQAGMTSLVTGAGEAESAIGQVSQGILKMSVDTGTSTQQLTAGMYMIESAGYHAANGGLDVLRVAAEGAKVGNADLGVVANALTTILTDYHLKATDAASAMNALVTTVASGKTHLQDLANSMASVLPLASSLHIQFPQIAGALATMTNAGMDAQRASMNLSNALRSLAAPGSTAVKSLKEVGLTSQQVNDVLSHQGLQQALAMIEEQVGKKFPQGSAAWTAAMKSIMGGATGLNVALMLGGKNMSAYESNIKTISTSMNAGGKSVQGWSKVQQDFNFKAEQAKAALGVLAIKVGQELLPAVGQLLAKVTPIIAAFADWLVKSGTLHNAVTLLVGSFTNMITVGSAIVSFFRNNEVAMDALKATLIVLAVIIGVVMVVALYSYAAAAYVAAAANIAAFWPVYLVIIIIIAIITVVILVVQHWGQIAHWLQGVWAAVASFFITVWGAVATFFVNLWNRISSATVTAWNAIVNGIRGIVTTIVTWLEARWQVTVNTIVGYFTWLYNHNYIVKALVDAIAGFFKWIHDTSVAIWTAVASFFVTIWNAIKNAAVVAWNFIVNVVTTVNKSIQSFLLSIWNAVVTWFAGVWNTISTKVQQGWTFISTIFSSAWSTYISGPLGSLWNSFSTWFGNLATQAYKWGVNLIQGFINGIQSMIGSVGQAAQNIIGTVASFLGFHSPAKEGEGRYIIQWGEGMVKGFVQGMKNAQPLLNGQITHMISAPSVALSGAGNSFALSRPSSSNQPQTVNMQINLDGREITHAVGVRMASEMRLQGAVRSR